MQLSRPGLPTAHPGRLTLIPLAAATYFMVSGGPYGIEELVQVCGYAGALAVLLSIPLIWSLPTGLMVGELSAALPDEGGFYVWVRRAMGSFWGFQEAWLSLVASVFDMAAYPALFVLSLAQIWPPAARGYNGVLIGGLMIGACLLWNLWGARAVGDGSVVLGVLLLSPFAFIVGLALTRHAATVYPGAHAAPAHGGILAGIMVAMWNYMGWDNASTVAGEVHNPRRTYPRVMLLALAAIVISYVIPVAAVWRTGVPVTAWSTGSWATIASVIGGPALGFALVAASMVSTFGIVNSLMMSYSRLPLAMAEDGYAPRLFSRKLANGAPWPALLLCAAAWTAALGLSFDRLLMLDILLYGTALVLEFIALAVLRRTEPDLPRPFRVPGGFAGAVVAGIGPSALLLVALLRNRDERMGGMSALALGLLMMAAGVAVYPLIVRMRQRGAEIAVHT